MTVFKKFCEILLLANDKTSKNIIFAGDFLNDFFTNIGRKMVGQIPKSFKTF